LKSQSGQKTKDIVSKNRGLVAAKANFQYKCTATDLDISTDQPTTKML